ncbi:MAG: TonB-dependent receptor [Asticcacaulis sp.]|uniref:TonB-dependent receptor n=1 Tax=Asticcacaulis sp. TaxID=1872648 RepID=UPI0039E38C44
MDWHGPSHKISMICLLILVAVASPRQASSRTVFLDVPRQAVQKAASDFAHQAGVQVLVTAENAAAQRGRAIRGQYEIEDALRDMLEGTHLHALRISADVYAIVPDTEGRRSRANPLPLPGPARWVSSQGPDTQVPSEIIITGTRLRLPNLSAASPVVTVTESELEAQGALNIEEALNRLPMVRADSTQFSNSSDTDGRSKLNLRNLGWQRTLVLLDGKRFMPVQAIDLNLVPVPLIKRVDVLTGGASATYGSDAVAGVVNLVLNTDFDGVAINAAVAAYQHTNDDSAMRALISQYPAISLPSKGVVDGQRTDLGISYGQGFAAGKGHVSAFIGRREQAAVSWSARDYSACRLVVSDDKLDCAVNTVYSPYGRYVVGSGEMAGSTYYGAQDGTRTFVGGDQSASYAYNTRATFAFQRPDTRLSGGFFVQYAASETLGIYLSLMGIDDRTRSIFYPALVRQTVNLNCDNPLMSAEQAVSLCGSSAGTDASVATDIAYELNGPGSERLDNLAINKDYRISLGAKGEIGEGWHFDLGYVGSRVYTSLSDNNEIDADRFARALNVVSVNGTPTCVSRVDGTDPDCVPADIFGYHTIDPAFYDYAYAHYQWSSVTQQQVLSATVSGNLTKAGLTSWAENPLAVAIGVEARRDALRNFADDATRAYEGWLSTTGGHFSVAEAYVESQLPLANHRPGVEDLELNLAWRTSFYDNRAKAIPTSRFELQYRPIQDVLLRLSFNRASRAPNISELYAPAYFSTNSSLVDSCAGGTPSASLAQCLNTGVTAAQYGHIEDCSTACRTYGGGGNSLVRPETARTLTYGFVVTPTKVPGLQVSVDYYRIRVSDFIDYIDATQALSNCLVSDSSLYCQLIHRDPATGALNGDGYVEGTTLNTYQLLNSGIDLQGQYGFALQHGGRIDVSLTGTWLEASASVRKAGEADVNCAGYFGYPNCYAPLPKWRHSLRSTWSAPGHRAALSLNWRYMGATRYIGVVTGTTALATVTSDKATTRVSSYNYFDLGGTIVLGDRWTAGLSINNLLDLSPPRTVSMNVDGTTNNPNTWTGTYDPLGRSLLFKLDFRY